MAFVILATPPDKFRGPPILLPSTENWTVPVGAAPATVAVNNTWSPTVDGFFDDVSETVTGLGLTVCTSVCEEGELAESPPYCARTVWLPVLKKFWKEALLTLAPPPTSETALPMFVPSTENCTDPVGELPWTVAANVTASLMMDGFFDDVSETVLPPDRTVCVALPVLAAKFESPE